MNGTRPKEYPTWSRAMREGYDCAEERAKSDSKPRDLPFVEHVGPEYWLGMKIYRAWEEGDLVEIKRLASVDPRY